MSIIVEHDKRKKEILEKSLDVFMDEGYEDATFQKIADRCGITRTTLYLYFKNKREIFIWSIKQFMSGMESDLASICEKKELPTNEKLKQVITLVILTVEKNRRLLSVVLNYLLHLSKSGTSPDDRVRRRTIRMRHMLAGIVIDGVRKGEIPPVNIRVADDLLYGLIESALFRLVVLGRPSVSEIIIAAELAIDKLCAPTTKDEAR